jgi:hypothetical protein
MAFNGHSSLARTGCKLSSQQPNCIKETQLHLQQHEPAVLAHQQWRQVKRKEWLIHSPARRLLAFAAVVPAAGPQEVARQGVGRLGVYNSPGNSFRYPEGGFSNRSLVPFFEWIRKEEEEGFISFTVKPGW